MVAAAPSVMFARVPDQSPFSILLSTAGTKGLADQPLALRILHFQYSTAYPPVSFPVMNPASENVQDHKKPLKSPGEVELQFTFRPAHPIPQIERTLKKLKSPELYGVKYPVVRHMNRPSTRLRKEDTTKPWFNKPRASQELLIDVMPIIGIILGVVVAAILVWDGWVSVINHDYTLVYEDDFSNGLDKSIWEPEIQVGGFG